MGKLRARGINYDTGFQPGEAFSRPEFDPGEVRRDMATIAGELHCDAVRISGSLPQRLSVAAEAAADAGLEVWFAPFPVDQTPPEMLALFEECARRAERARRAGAAVVFVTGCEASVFGSGFVPGATYRDRLAGMTGGDPAFWAEAAKGIEAFAAFLPEAAATARRSFGGPISYASGPWEPVDWAPFDFVGVDAYRPTDMADHLAHGKPVAVTEFGTCPYRGAGELGGMAWQPPRGAVHDEDEQVRYLNELSEVFERIGIDTALWFTYARFKPGTDGGLGSYAVVEPDGRRRKVFAAMAQRYQMI